MTVRLTCTQARFETLTEDAHNGRSRHAAVLRQALKDLLIDHNRLLKAAKRAVDVVEPGGNERNG